MFLVLCLNCADGTGSMVIYFDFINKYDWLHFDIYTVINRITFIELLIN